MSFARVAPFVVSVLCLLQHGFGANFKREASFQVVFVKSSTEDWHVEDLESSKKETPHVTDHNPGNSATKRLTFKAFDKSWTLDLQKNNILFGKSMAFEIRDPNSEAVMQTLAGPQDCLYIGTVDAGRNEAGMAAVSTCRGQLRATLITNLNDYMINPVIRRGRKRSAADNPIQLLKKHINSTITSEFRATTKRSLLAEDILHQPLLRPDGRVLFYETGVIVDRKYTDQLYLDLSIDNDDLPYYIADLFNAVQLWYLHPTLGYQIWLSLQKVIIIQYDIPIRGDTGSKLAGACTWQADTYSENAKWDGTFILTGDTSILGGINGLAFPGTACDKAYAHCAGVAANHHQSLMSRSIAHEGMHVLGPMDDYVKPYVDTCYTGMMREGLFEDRDWSTCSVQMLEHYIELRPNTCLQSDSTLSASVNKLPELPSNVAWRSSAKQSSTYHSEAAWGAWKAVDGSITGVPHIDPNPVLGSCTRTQAEKDPWLLVTLPEEHTGTAVRSVHVYNREDCCGDRLHDLEVRIGNDGDFSNNPLCAFYKGVVPGGRYGMAVIQCDRPLSGRFVSVQIKGGDKEVLTVCELMVYQDIQLPFYKNPEYECADVIYGCPGWKRRGQCSTYKTECAYTCGTCTRAVPHPTIASGTIHPPYSTDEPPCRDETRACHHYLANGQCHEGDNMRRCPLSCTNCKKPTTTPAATTTTTSTTTTTTPEPPCLDKRPAECPGWASAGHCDLNPALLHVECRMSCGLCTPGSTGGCADLDSNCAAWAKSGSCQSAPHIIPTCKKSCGAC